MPEVEIILPPWKPKQLLLWESKATEILIAGDTRSGKSFFVRKAYIIYCSQIPGLICDILRLNWEDVRKNYMVGETSFPALLDSWERSSLVTITQDEIRFWNGSIITLGHCADDRALRKHQGNPTHLRTIDESAQFTESNLRGLGGWMSVTEEFRQTIPEKWRPYFPKTWHLTNFIGPGMGYYRRGFLEPRAPFEVEMVGQHARQFVPMFLADNDSEDAARVIARIKEAYPDPMVQKALLECDWRSMAGDFMPEWDENRHVVPELTPPPHWFRFRGLDLGYAEPCATLWVAVSDGEPFTDGEGKERWFPRGAFVVYNEWYICDAKDPAKGLRYRNEDIRDGIIARTEPGHKSDFTLTDSLPFQDRGGESVPEVFANKGKGIVLTLGDTSRVTGWNALRSRLIGYEEPSLVDKAGKSIRVPMLFITENCQAVRTYVPMLQRHPSEKKKEDAVEHGEATHICDTLRIICMAHTIIKDKVTPIKTRIERELRARRPTINNIMKDMNANGFNRG